jgi:hypothetical protein
MILSIAIILGIDMILNIIKNNGNYDVLMASALVISLFALNVIVAVVVLILLIIIGLNAPIEK